MRAAGVVVTRTIRWAMTPAPVTRRALGSRVAPKATSAPSIAATTVTQ